MLRLLYVTETLGRGGAEQSLIDLAPQLKERGVACAVAVLRPPYDLAPQLADVGIPVHRLDLRHRWDIARGVGGIAALARSRRFDLIQAQLAFPVLYAGLSSPFASSLPRLAYYMNLGYASYPPNSTWRRVRRRLDRVVAHRLIDSHIAASMSAAEHYREHLQLHALPHVIPLAVDLSGIDRSPDLSPGLRDLAIVGDRPLVVVPARLVPEKGHRYLVQALDLMRRAGGPAAQVLCVGDGPARASIAADIERLGLQGAMTLHPAVPRDDVLALMRFADIVVLPSTHEGFGIVAVEALALGRAFVGTSVGGLREIVDDGRTGRLVPPADPTALCDALMTTLSDGGLRERLGTAGRSEVLRRYGADRVAVQWLAHWATILERKPSA